ncbi:hypothetical protein GCM10010468_47790 [Actinocorallia longicatena]|uniref:Aminoglycoside phosphotransferase domain-containing protein n=1 Tax=Actinocorallia longicatena TaxID=111803 RepID=A0ABP6QH06_9ACTN
MAEGLPGYRVGSVTPLGEGEDHIAFQVNDELIVRFGKDRDPEARAARVSAEARLLAGVAELSPVPVPEPVFMIAELGCLGYFKLPGVPLIDMDASERPSHAPSIAARLGELLRTLHTTPPDRMTGLVEIDDHPATAWLEEAARTYADVAETIPRAHRAAVERFLATTPPDRHGLVFSHNDLGIEHVLVDPATWTVTGIIDWSDAAIVDPACDFGLIHRDLGTAALDRALAGYPADLDGIEAIRARAGFYARCGVLEDLAYGLQDGHRRYLGKSLDALEWLYPAARARSTSGQAEDSGSISP